MVAPRNTSSDSSLSLVTRRSTSRDREEAVFIPLLIVPAPPVSPMPDKAQIEQCGKNNGDQEHSIGRMSRVCEPRINHGRQRQDQKPENEHNHRWDRAEKVRK